MPVFLAALIGGLVQAAGSFIGAALIALGISAVTFKGVDMLFEFAKSRALEQFDAAAAYSDVGAWFGVLHVGTCINILFSALLARLVLKGLTGGSIKRWVTK